MMKKGLLILFILVQLSSLKLFAQQEQEFSPSPFAGIWTNTKNSHTGMNVFWHLGAAGATALMIITPADQKIVEMEKSYLGKGFDRGALLVGSVWHILPAAIVYRVTDNPEHRFAAGAVVQAVGIAFLVTTAEKIIVGRAFIDRDDDTMPGFFPVRKSTDAHDFYPFQNLTGLWPSGHTATAFAAASALTSYYRRDESFHKIALVTYTASALMGLAMINGNFHWASDVVAGFLIGHAIGWTVGADFRKRYDGRNTTKAHMRPSFIPVIANGNYGFQVRIPL